MNYITLSMIGLTVLPILFGVLLGLLRGSRRALLRLILVAVSIALAFALTGVVSESLMGMRVDSIDGTVVEYMQREMLSSLPESLSGYVIPLAQSILQVVVFLLLFFVLWFLTWLIVYPLCKLFVKPKRIKDGNGNVVKTKKRRWLGAIIGAVQGVLVAACVCIVFTGLLVQTSKIMAAATDLTDTIGEMSAEANTDGDVRALEDVDYDPDEGYTNPDDGEQSTDVNPLDILNEYTAMIAEYVDSPIGKMYNSIGAQPFDWITSVKVNDTKVTFSSQVDTLCNIVDDIKKLAKEFVDLQSFDFSKLLEDGNVEDLQDLFDRLDAVMNDLSDETKAIIDDIISSVAGDAGLDIGDMKFTDIDFHKEGQIIVDMYEYTKKDELTMEDANDIVEKLVDSDLAIGIVSSQDFDIDSKLNEAQLDAVANKIDEMEQNGTVSQDKIDALRSIFGLDANSQPEQGELEQGELAQK